jgi:pimeloyl-ACP methyl ester carboxylesterase
MAELQSHHTRIDYRDRGRGEPALLFLPGWCGSRAVFDRVIDLLAPSHRTLSLDWPGHGASELPREDFGAARLVDDALAVIEATGSHDVVPVALAHAGWVAIELRRRLAARIPELVLLDWIVAAPPPPFVAALRDIQQPALWRGIRDQLFTLWLHGSEQSELVDYVRRDMGSYPAEMWARSGREIGAAYVRESSPLAALAKLVPAVPTLHVCAQPDDPASLQRQQAFAEEHSWFRVHMLQATSHFLTIEAPQDVAQAITAFVA